MTLAQTFADALIEAHRSGTRADAAALQAPDYAQALEIQRRVQATLGPVGGFKVGTRPEGAPMMAPISAAKVARSGAARTVNGRMGIELEVGLELLTDPVPDMMANPQRHFRPCVLIEIVDTRLTGADDNAAMKLADMQINDGMVVGPALDDWDGSDFGTATARLTCGETTVVDGPVSVPGGSALKNLALLLDNLGDHCGGLAKGQIVITGSVSGLAWFPAGTDVDGWIEGLGAVSCRLV
ncbi:hydratase [Maliponia aquimaris]|uniref:2-keto-4-pentenoate hydratase n=1 Tax=Maliponia aquimaris TaxID=1673631 RepID=A0A238JTQ3_9RHOB|nr:hydratase [Maliponia aquimaris]SMX33202.1 hypothetical protein MAA8898_00417 [Maliponia aquimaris]